MKTKPSRIDAALSRELNPHQAAAKTREDYLLRYMYTSTGPYSWAGHEALREPLCNEDPRVVILKGVQIGISTGLIGIAIYHNDVRKHDVGYFLPTDDLAQTFSKTKLDIVVERSPHVKAILQQEGRQAKKRDEIQLKRFGDHFTAIGGLTSIINAISTPFDLIIFDEVDDLNRFNRTFARDRIKHSRYAREIYTGVGRIPGAGIDAEYQESDQRKLHYTCPSCGEADQILEELFPDNIFPDKQGHWYIGCVKCGLPLRRDSGVWKATKKSPKTGYRVSRLNLGFTDIDKLWREYQEAQLKPTLDLPLFRCSNLALPDAGLGQPITAKLLDALTGDFETAREAPYAFCGIDRGNLCHLLIGVPGLAEQWRIVHLESLPESRLEERMRELAPRYNLAAVGVDIAPGISGAQKVAQAVGIARTWFCAFSNVVAMTLDKAYKPTPEDEEYQRIACNRDEAIANYVDLFVSEPPQIRLPRPRAEQMREFELFRAHHMKLERVYDPADLNMKRPKFRDKCENHFGMAGVYMRLCRQAHLAAGNFGIGAMPGSVDVRGYLK